MISSALREKEATRALDALAAERRHDEYPAGVA
jgi:predicted dithiol-disulfide oxidoreductase (DUF899 family)